MINVSHQFITILPLTDVYQDWQELCTMVIVHGLNI